MGSNELLRRMIMGLSATMGAPNAPRAINGPDQERVNSSFDKSRNVPV